ncbi:MAG: nodulation protein NfeD [Spirochaetaceae bacterium]|nr:MAG: nodulation protein NfeD [Spirochaetaceae bacterium]
MGKRRWLSLAIVAFIVLVAGTAGAQQQDGDAAERDLPAGASRSPAEVTEAEAVIIPIYGDIDAPLYVFIRRSIEKAGRLGAGTIILDIDTFGGRVDSALQIANLIGSQTDMRTVAYVRLRPDGIGVSWSAGALISMASDTIFMAPGTSMGAAAPVLQTPEGAQAADEKAVSAVRTQMAALAEKNGYPVPIALAMVDSAVEVHEVFVDGEMRILTRDELEALERRAEQDGRTVERGIVISEPGKLLSLTAGEMARFGVSSGTPQTFEELYDVLGIGADGVVLLERDAADQLVAFLTGAAFTSLLVMVGLGALFFEITSPGFGIPGTIAILCFSVLFSGNFLLGQVGSVELILFLVGLVLLILEIFVIPGFGVAGISGIVLMLSSLVLAQQDFIVPDFDWQWSILQRNLLIVLASAVGAFVVFGIAAAALKRAPGFNRLALQTTQDVALGYTVQGSEVSERYLGKRGFTVTALRPVGNIEIDDELLQAEADGEYLDRGVEVEVTEVSGNHMVVRKV